jgi:hypothetical protein
LQGTAIDRAGGNLFFRGALYELLSNPIYIGEIRHKGVRNQRQHEPIAERELWDSTQLLLRSHAARRIPRARKSAASPLTGKLFDDSGQSLTPSHAVKGERRYRQRGALYTLLRNPIHLGEVRHKGVRYPGQHQPIVERSMWDKTQEGSVATLAGLADSLKDRE